MTKVTSEMLKHARQALDDIWDEISEEVAHVVIQRAINQDKHCCGHVSGHDKGRIPITHEMYAAGERVAMENGLENWSLNILAKIYREMHRARGKLNVSEFAKD